jgi:hypothetical protein
MQTARGENKKTLLGCWRTQYRIMDAACMWTVLWVRNLRWIPVPGRSKEVAAVYAPVMCHSAHLHLGMTTMVQGLRSLQANRVVFAFVLREKDVDLEPCGDPSETGNR